MQPLDGVRVLDLSRLLPGPFASQILRDLGAEVIKVEDPQGGDYGRYYPPLCADGNAASFHALNRGKKSIILDFKKAEGRDAFIKLCGTADVVLESFRPGVLERLGLGPKQMLQKYPSLIFCSISGYGQTGPDRLRAGHDVNYLARSGVLGLMQRPSLLPVQVADICGGSYPAVVQILAALRRKEKSGQGSIIDVSMADSAFALLAMPWARHSLDGQPFGSGSDLLVGSVPCYDIYETKDGFISVGALEHKFWAPLVTALGLPELKDASMATGDEGRLVRQRVQAALKQKTNQEWDLFFRDKDCTVEIVRQPEHVNQVDPQLKARELTISVKVDGDGSSVVDCTKTPINMSGVVHPAVRAPRIGEHTDEILSQLTRSKL